METRKVQVIGNNSYSISLPKDWIKENNIQKQDSLFVLTNDNNEVIIKNNDTKIKNLQKLSVKINNISNISEFLVFCYVKNIEKLTFNFDKFDYQKVKDIKNTLKFLEGYDIIFESEEKIEISFVFVDINIDIFKISQRIRYLLKLLVSALNNNDKDTLEETENSIDKLYHLSKRILFSCIKDRKLREINKIETEDELFFFHGMYKCLEGIADNMYALQDDSINDKNIELLTEIIDHIDKLMTSKMSINDAKAFFNSIKSETDDTNVKMKFKRIQDLCIDILEFFISIEYNRRFFLNE